jgi:hypothetical protein
MALLRVSLKVPSSLRRVVKLADDLTRSHVPQSMMIPVGLKKGPKRI